MATTRRLVISTLACLVCLVSAGSRASRAAAEALPASLDDRTYWRLIETTSEPNGSFRSENLVSNERTYQMVIPGLVRATSPGGVYLGVAPDQNFAYILALRPAMAFIVDIRRGNLLEHLMYKALFEMSADRAEFVSRLFSRPRPAGLGKDTSAHDLFAAFDTVRASEPLFQTNLKAMRDLLESKHRFALSSSDEEQLELIYSAFLNDGPDLRYTALPAFGGPIGRSSNNAFAFSGYGPDFPSYAELQEVTDADGVNRGYLASDANYQFLKAFEGKNLLVPVVGNFAGPHALKGVGDYIRAHGAVVDAFYVSNVEQYLMQDGIFDRFAGNVATLPIDGNSTFIRSVWSRFGYQGTLLGPDGRASALDPIRSFIRDQQAGAIQTYYDLNVRSR
jgi:hypothetical protein